MNKSFMGKKLLSLLLSVLMCLSLIPTVAFATIAEGETVSTEETLISALENGGEIKLAANIELTAKLVMPADKEILLDLGEYNITQTADEVNAINLSSGDKVNIIGSGTITGNNNGVYVPSGAKLTVDGVTIKATVYNGIYNEGNTVINSGTLLSDGGYNGIYTKGTLTVNGGTVNTVYVGSGSVTVNGGTIGKNADGDSFLADGGKLTVTNGTVLGWVTPALDTAISGGTFNGSVYANQITGGTFNGSLVMNGENPSVTGATINSSFSWWSKTIPTVSNVVFGEKAKVTANSTGANTGDYKINAERNGIEKKIYCNISVEVSEGGNYYDRWIVENVEDGTKSYYSNAAAYKATSGNKYKVTATVSAIDGYKFDGWYLNGVKLTEGIEENGSLNYTFTISEDATFTAQFVERELDTKTAEFFKDYADVTEYTVSSEDEMELFAYAVSNLGYTFEGKTVKLGANLDFTGKTYRVVGNETYTFNGVFDGNGKTISNITATTSGKFIGLFGKIANATVKDLTLKDSMFNNGGVGYAGGIAAEAGVGVEITNCTVSNVITYAWFSGSVIGHTFGGVTVENVTATGCTASGSKCGVIAGYSDSMTIKDVTVTDVKEGAALIGHANAGANVIEDVTVDAPDSVLITTTYSESNGSITFKGENTSVKAKGVFDGSVAADSKTVTVEAGKFTKDGTTLLEVSGYLPYGKTQNSDGTVSDAEYVAKIGDVGYESLQAAIDAAKSGATVTLVADAKENVTVEKNAIVLDLNGYTLNGGTEKGKPALAINNKKVTVKDSSVAQTGTIKREDTNGAQGHYVIDIQGKNGFLLFEGGNVENDSGVVGVRGASLVRLGNDSVSGAYPVLTIRGGKFTQNNFIAIKVDRGTLHLQGGEVNSANSYAIENWNNAYVEGGTVNGTVSSWVYSTGAAFSKLTISSGKVNGNVASVNYDDAADKQARIFITGGEITGTLGIYTYNNGLNPITDNTKATIEVTGGTFDIDPTRYVTEAAVVSGNEDGKFGVEKVVLAKIGDTDYYTMDDAFHAVKAGETIVMQRNYKTDSVQNSGSKSFTIDLNGHTWTYTRSDADCAAFEINYSDVTLTVKNGTVISNTLVGLIPTAMSGTITYNNSALIFEEVEMTANGHCGIETNGGNTNDTVTLKNSTLNVPNGYGIYFASSGSLNIENSKITAKTMGVQVCAGSLNISGGSVINVTGDPVEKTENDGAIEDGAAVSVVNRTGYKGLETVKISGGTFTAKSGEAFKAYTWENKTESEFGKSDVITVSGGTFSNEIPRDYCAEGLTASKNSDGTYTVKDITYAVEVGGVKYETVNAAIAAAKDGDTVTLLSDTTEDVLINKSITLDLGGKTLTGTGAASTATLTIAKGAVVTVKNGSIVGTANSYYTIQNNGTATFEGITATAGNTGSSMIDNFGTLAIKSGTYTGGLDVVKNESGAALNVSGGTFTLEKGTSKGFTGVIFNYGKLEISGGRFIQGDKSAPYGQAQVIHTDKSGSSSPSTVITGGTFENLCTRSTAWTVRVTNAAAGSTKVSGGTFNKKISDGYCADGYIPTQNTDGTYGVKEGKYVAEVGSTKYETLADAIRLAAKGKTIKLLEDIEVNSTLSIAKNLIIDLNGKTLTGKTGSYMFNIADTASVTFENGTINVADNYGAMNVYGQLSLQNVNIEGAAVERPLLLINGNANVTVDKDTTVYANANVKNCYPAILFEDSEEYHNPILKVYGTIKAIMMPAIQGNGADKGTTDIYIYDGAKVLSNKLAMYLPQLCNVNITGGLVEGYCGIGIKSGTLNISGGEVRGIANDDVIDDKYSQTNGISYDGSAILIDSYIGYAGQVKINISGNAVVKSLYSTAIREIGNNASQTNVVAIGISGGQILGASGKQAVLVRETSVSTVSISGGTFSSAVPADYCADGFIPKDNGDGTYGVTTKPAVSDTKKLTVTIGTSGEVSYTTKNGLSGTWYESFKNSQYENGTYFTVTAKPDGNYKFLYWINSEGRILSENPTYSFYLNDNVTIEAVFYKTTVSTAYVVFKDFGNSILGSGRANADGTINVPEVRSHAGYKFVGWFDEKGNQYTVTDGKITVSASCTVLAKYEVDSDKLYTVTVDGEAIGEYKYDELVTVTANVPDGKYFAGWYVGDMLVSYDEVYKFYISGNTALTAKYSDEAVEKAPLVSLIVSERNTVSANEQYIVITAAWNIDSDYEISAAGILYTADADKQDKLTLEGAAEDGDVYRSDSVDPDKEKLSNNGSYKYTLTLRNAYTSKNIYAVAYVTYVDGNGNSVTIYTTIQICAA